MGLVRVRVRVRDYSRTLTSGVETRIRRRRCLSLRAYTLLFVNFDLKSLAPKCFRPSRRYSSAAGCLADLAFATLPSNVCCDVPPPLPPLGMPHNRTILLKATSGPKNFLRQLSLSQSDKTCSRFLLFCFGALNIRFLFPFNFFISCMLDDTCVSPAKPRAQGKGCNRVKG